MGKLLSTAALAKGQPNSEPLKPEDRVYWGGDMANLPRTGTVICHLADPQYVQIAWDTAEGAEPQTTRVPAIIVDSPRWRLAKDGERVLYEKPPNPYERTYGESYDDKLSTKEIAARIRKDIKQAIAAGELPGGCRDYSVRYRSFSGGSSIDITVKRAAYTIERPEVTRADPREADTVTRGLGGWMTDGASAVIDRLKKIHDAYNHDGSDTMSDYWDVNYYGHAEFDWQLVDKQREFVRSIGPGVRLVAKDWRKPKARLQSATIVSSEGGERYDGFEFSDWRGIDSALREIAAEAPTGGAYRKTSYRVKWRDGSEFRGRFDIRHIDERQETPSGGLSLGDAIEGALRLTAGDGLSPEMAKHRQSCKWIKREDVERARELLDAVSFED